MSAAESSAVIRFIAETQRQPVDRGIFSRRYAPPMTPVLVPTRRSLWKARLTIAASLLAVGVTGGLVASQTEPGRWLVETIGSTQTELSAARPATPTTPTGQAAAIVTCSPAAPATPAAAPVAPSPAAPPPAPSPSTPVLAIATPLPPGAPAPAPATSRSKDRPRREGTLRIRSMPACDIVVDGRRTGLRTPQRALKLKPGKHTIVLVNKKARIRKKLSVRIQSGETTRLTQDLRRDKKH